MNPQSPAPVVPPQLQTQTVHTVPGPWMFILDYPRAPKGLSQNDRPNRWVKAGSVKDVRFEVMARVRQFHLGVLDKVRVDVVWVVGDHRRRDTDNLAPFLKAIYDGIGADRGVSAHLVDDDDPTHMEKPGATIRYEKGARAHFEITITEVTA